MLANLNQVLNAENRQRIAQTLAHLEATTATAQATILQLRPLLSDENLRVFKSALARADQAVGQAGPFFAEARVLVGRLQAASDKFEAALGDSATGGAGALAPRLNELSLDLSSTSRQLERVLQHFEYSPQSLIFGTPSAPPGPGEAGFALPMAPVNLGERR